MIDFEIIQSVHTGLQSQSKYDIVLSNDTVYNAETISLYDFEVTYKKKRYTCKLHSETFTKDRYLHIFDRNKNDIGGITGTNDRAGMIFKNTMYSIYRVGMKNEGIYWPVYKRYDTSGEAQVGVIHKDNFTAKMLDRYDCHCLYKEDILPIVIFGLYTDMLEYSNIGKKGGFGFTVEYEYVWGKELLEKHNPNFYSKRY